MVLTSAAGGLLVAQFVLLFFLGRNYVPFLKYVGYALWALGAVLGWLPILVLRRTGGVAKGRSYVHTTRLVTTGIYAVIRHPQYLSMYPLALGLMLIGQHWLIVLIGVLALLLYSIGLRGADRRNIEKFGEEYRSYAARVPAYNVFLGLVRLLRRPRPPSA